VRSTVLCCVVCSCGVLMSRVASPLPNPFVTVHLRTFQESIRCAALCCVVLCVHVVS
jgi:hypothetical protein